METLNSTVGVYKSHKKAVQAVRELQEAGFPIEKISLLGSAKIEDDHLHVIDSETVFDTVAATGSVLGTILGALAGMSIIAVPGLGLLYAAGALVGAVGGLSIGSISGGIAGALLALGIGKDGILLYKEHLKEGKFLVVVHGSQEDADKAHEILEKTEHHEINKH